MVLKKSRVAIAMVLVALLACASVLTAYGIASKSQSVQAVAKRKIPVYSVQTDEKIAAISFDAAWGADKTLKILDILDEYDVKATFFLVGFWIDAYPETVKEISNRGHLIGNHSANHPHFNKLSKADMEKEISVVSDKVKELTGQTVGYFRAPFGEYNDTLMTVLEEQNLTGVQWDVDSLDWKGISAAEITERVLKRVQPGSIVLFHNAAENTPEALPGIIESLLADGYTIVPISQILLTGDFTIDHTGRQCGVK